MEKNAKTTFFIILLLIIITFPILIITEGIRHYQEQGKHKPYETFKIISSNENKDLEDILQKVAKENNISLSIDYAGTIDIMDKLNQDSNYDAVWASNSIWLYMLDKNIKIRDSKSTSINPVVLGIKKSKAEELGFVEKEIYTKDILNAIKQNKLKFSMTTPTQTNTGATAYLGFLSTLAGNPEVLTEEKLEDEKLKKELIELYSGVTRSSGSEEFLEEMFLNGKYEATITYETSIINMNKKLEARGEEPLYIVYPKDGVSISDSPFAYIDHKKSFKKEEFDIFQKYILSNEGQKELMQTGRRVWFGGTNENVDKTIFNPKWGIDTTKYLVPVKYPNKTVIMKALGIYQTELRKPVHMVFCLDYSGSMRGEGNRQLLDAMNFILNEEEASKNLLQFTKKDKITVIPFTHEIKGMYQATEGDKTEQLIRNIENTKVSGGTDIYIPGIEALKLLDKENMEEKNVSIILMTDGESNTDSFSELEKVYRKIGKDIPIYSIMFGSAEEYDLERIAGLTNGKVFDGRTDLLKAFKEVRGYN